MVFPSSNNGMAFKYTFEKQNSQPKYFTQKEKQTSLSLYTPKTF